MPPSISEVRLEALGAARVVRLALDGIDEVLGPGKPLALAVYLASAPKRAARREHLLDLLWSDAEPGRARASLRQAAFVLRQTLGEHAVSGDAHTLALTDAVAFDRSEFLDAVHANDTTRAIALYRGPFLVDFAIPGGAGFEQWVDVERTRLALLHARVLEAVVRRNLDAGDVIAAVQAARVLRDANPASEAAWRLLLEALDATGERLQVVVEADALERMLSNDERIPELATAKVLQRARRLSTQPSGTTSPLRGIAHELIGREREFAVVLAAWKRARTGTAKSVEIVGAPGLGKTRLLGEIEERLRTSRACVVHVRALPGTGDMLGASAADLVRSLVELPGALGISPAAAASMAALQPAVSSHYKSPPDQAVGDDALRRRTFALVELIECIAQEQPLALLIDDLHWMDSESIQILSGAFARLSVGRLLVVTASRPSTKALRLQNARAVELRPLDGARLAALVRSIGADERSVWSESVLAALLVGTGGTPLLVVDALQFAIDQGHVRLTDGVWVCSHPDMLENELRRGGSIGRRLARLSATEQQVIRLGAVAGAPLRVDALAVATGETAESMVALVRRLEEQRLLRNVRGEYELAHDEIADAVLRGIDVVGLTNVHRTIGCSLSHDRDRLTAADYRRAAHHFVKAADNDSLANLYNWWLAFSARHGDRRSDGQLAIALVDNACTASEIRRLLQSRPAARRLGLRTSRQAAMAALLAVGVGLTALTVIASTQEPSPSQIGVVVAPTSFAERLPPMPIAVVELQDAKGRRVGRSGDSIHVAIERGGTLGGVTTAATNDGRASFPDATILTVDTADLVLRFTGPGLRPARVHVSGAAEAQSTLQLVSATLNGQALTDAAKTIRITTGDSIAGSLEFRYTSGWVAAAVVLGVTSTWTERSRAFSTIGALTTPASGVAYRANIRLAGPRLPGRYHLIFAFQAEDAVSFVMSGTNWQVGAPVWNDGNDVVDWTEGQLEEAQREGHVRSTVLRPTGRYQATVPAAVIDVEAVIPRQ